ncbi:lipoprotein-releasing ABC transporter permease subunit LolE [Vibrio sp. SM6]|uniref:Lipoprotein-releasing ABC transporter permease subunit LolE n=1 Tax=Vibrio agarilyticus TaxID=2726741 RepID=A0A7X8YGV0_9VIBR|nr:lipoprotein-releasing ABC transporter permease subunit LolE [Vibrio agarilyticus]NLS13044.1 lipoprotein-releasing ABC transporter permease subunit LolE [Vibrio agarilyticus]
MSLALTIGYRFSRAKKRNKMVSFISVSSMIGIAVGVAVIIIGLSAMNGFERELQQRVLSVVSHAEMEGVNAPIEQWPLIIEQATEHPQVIAGAPYVRLTGLVEKGATMKALEIRGIDAQLEPQVSSIFSFVDKKGQKAFLPGQRQMILGKGIADTIGAKVGDFVTLLIPQAGESQKVTAPKRIRVQVAGLLTLNGQIDHSLALLPLQDAQEYAGLASGVTGISLKTSSVLESQNIVREAGQQVSAYVYLRSWQQKFGYLYRDIQMVRTIMYLVMVLVIGVACFNIVSTLMMAVKDRAADIAILRTMGANDRLIKRIFISQGLFSGVLGSVIGSVLGVLVASNLTALIRGLETLVGHQFLSGDIYFVDFLPSQLMFSDVIVVSATAIALSLCATWYPASRAAKVLPAAVLSGH